MKKPTEYCEECTCVVNLNHFGERECERCNPLHYGVEEDEQIELDFNGDYDE